MPRQGWLFGPVFAYEWLTVSRRWQVYAGRVVFLLVLLVSLSLVWAARVAGHTFPTIGEMAAVGRAFYGAIVFSQLTLVLLATPAATAGAICQDKVRGTLGQLLITDLSDTEIVLGRLAARLVPILGMVCCALPVLAVGSLLGGIDPGALSGAFGITVAVAVLTCTMTFTFSVWGIRPYEVLLATFAVLTIWLLACPVWEFFVWIWRVPPPPHWVIFTHPYLLAFAPYARPGEVGLVDYLVFFAAVLLVSAALAVLSILRLRRVVVAQADGRVRRRRTSPVGRFLFGESRDTTGRALDRNPVLWYEERRKRLTPWIRALIGLYTALAVGFSALAVVDCFRPVTWVMGWLPAYVNAFQVVMGLPLFLISASMALVDERARGSLDVLLTTPLSSPRIVLAKWWSVFRQVPLLLVLPTLLATVLTWGDERWWQVDLLVAFLLAQSAAWTSVGLALSTWFRRVGRAVSMAVVLFTIVSLAWPMVATTLFSGYHERGNGLACVSPFYGSFYLTLGLVHVNYIPALPAWGLLWTCVHTFVAEVLLLAVLATFNRSIGRIPERSRRRASRPWAAPEAPAVPSLEQA